MADCTGDDGLITIEDLTGGEIRGNGDFDELMRVVKSNIEDQFTKNRITGASYSEVYLGALTQVLQTSSQFALTKCRSTYEYMILQEQVTQNEWQTCLIMKQIEDLEAGIQIKKCQLDIMDVERLGILANTDLTVAKTFESTCSLEVMGSTIAVNDTQIVKMTAETGYTNQQCSVAIQQEILVTCNQDNVAAQTALGVQKTVTETAQTDESVLVGFSPIAGCTCSYTGGGAVGAQISLQYKQRDAFDRDSEQKYAKMMQDSFSVQLSVLGTYTELDAANQQPLDIGNAIALVKAGAGG